jgi:hypothetical protein
MVLRKTVRNLIKIGWETVTSGGTEKTVLAVASAGRLVNLDRSSERRPASCTPGQTMWVGH